MKCGTMLSFHRVFIVVHANYGDQGVDVHGAFSTREKAYDYIDTKEPDNHEKQWWSVEERTIDLT